MFKVDTTQLPPSASDGHLAQGPLHGYFEALNATMAARNLWPHVRGMYGAYLDGKDSVPESELRSFAAFDGAPDLDLPEGLEQFDIPVCRIRARNPGPIQRSSTI